MGSGSLAAMGVMESNYKDGMTEDEAKNLCIAAIEAGVYHDLGSGSNVDICVMKKGKSTMYRNIRHDNFKKYEKPGGYSFPKERVVVMRTYENPTAGADGAEKMDLS